MQGLTRKQVADTAGVTIEAVRFYEREGLIEEPPRTEANYRQYPDDAVIRIRFIKRAQNLGFSCLKSRSCFHPECLQKPRRLIFVNEP